MKNKIINILTLNKKNKNKIKEKNENPKKIYSKL